MDLSTFTIPRETSEKSQKSSVKRSKRARPLEPEDVIPVPEGSDKNPDVVKTIDSRSQKSKTLKKSKEVKGFILEKDKSVRRLEDNSRYLSVTSLRCIKQEGEGQDPAGKCPSERKSTKSRSRKSKRSGKISSKKATAEPKSLKKSKREKTESVKKGVVRKHEKPRKLKKVRKPWKSIFKLKRGKREKGSPLERCGTWA